MKKCKISLTGDLGSGKSTLCKILKEKFSAEVVSVGTIQRSMAKDMGMTTCEFSHYMEQHPEIDNRFDEMIKSYDSVNDKSLLFDSRLAWNFVPSAMSVYVTTDLQVAAERVLAACREDEMYSSLKEAMEKLSDRRRSELKRYSSIYGLDLNNIFNYDLVADSTTASAEEIAELIAEAYSEYEAGNREQKAYISVKRLYPVVGAEPGGELVGEKRGHFYFVTGGTDKLKEGIKNNVPFVKVKMCEGLLGKDNFCGEEYNDFLKKWEKENGFSYIRYPFL
ncbi:MAG: AAA family ATPase [Christensenellaceae bacterium]|nr:AAA family ATPase [Christensenellaceae bacterium]MDD6926483.1 AAA family ATPase [bacterium]MDY2851691.1 AAA family ATPase [Christensenellaceae bacterium]